ncbi:MAG: methylmalonyl-CoA epimerase [Bacteroidetes bacterium]|nr:MAG: methylmalonyl-CoA epimerase [Bacteroidota bacterium]
MKLSHIGIAVKNLNEASNVFSKLFNINHIPIEEVTEQKVRVGFCHVGDSSVELTEATSADSPIAKYIEKRGEGVHHLSFEVENLEEELRRLKSEGFQLIDEEPRVGAGGYLIAFIHPKSTNGVLVELSQKIG